MKTGHDAPWTRTLVGLAGGVYGLLVIALCSNGLWAQTEEPIAYIGHGVFFDRNGNQLPVSQAFVDQAQAWYRQDMLARLPAAQRAALARFDTQLNDGVAAQGQARQALQQRSLEWLFANTPSRANDDRTLGKLRALQYALTLQLPDQPGAATAEQRAPFTLPADVERKLAAVPSALETGVKLRSITVNSGQAYLNECMAAKVPIPPPIGKLDPAGLAGWKSQGFIPTGDQFIVGTPAEVRTYQSTSPAGMCYALPRYSDGTRTTVSLDGVICLSQETSKVCLWDNQMSGSGFSFPAGTQIPIGVPNTAIDPMGRYQAGGFELQGGSGGVCTDCHAGENPYITHPKSNLGGGVLWETLRSTQNLPTFAPNRYDPLVGAAWPQNQLSQAGPTLPTQCNGCHVKVSAGRFPHLSDQLPGYCNTVLANAIARTMPPGSAGSAAAAATTFRNTYCNAPPNASAADAGDPHLTTTNGIQYDFQSAGEFVALRNSDTGFELQTRQSPVQTTFTPPANPYTGLASCVSLNTAVALRVGKNRVTYQPGVNDGRPGRMQLRIDGVPAALSTIPIALSGGTVSQSASGGGLEVKTMDGTALIVTPLFWGTQNYWYLDVDVRTTPAREGTMGPVLAGDWLPRAPDGASFGPMPPLLSDRHVGLNQKFASAWRVNRTNSLFDYAPGTSTTNFTDTNWPPEAGQVCATRLPGPPPLRRMQPELARSACARIKDSGLRANCVFDVTVMGDASVAKGYQLADSRKR